MGKVLITQSLLSSWGYMFRCNEDNQDAAQAAFMQVLNREPIEQSDAMRSGIQFECEVYKAAAGIARQPHPKWENGIQSVSRIIKGAPVQIRVRRDIEVCGINFLLYGVLDAMQAGTIYDVKFVSASFCKVDLAGKYLDSPQHPAYLYMVPEAVNFEYLVSDGSDLYKETYDRASTRPISDIIAEFVHSLEALNLLEIYKEKWLAK